MPSASALTLFFKLAASFGNLRRHAGDLLLGRFEFEADLAALAAEGFHLLIGRRQFALQTLRIPLQGGNALLGLDDAVAHIRGRRNRVHDGATMLLLLALHLLQRGRRVLRLLLPLAQLGLGFGNVCGSRFQHLLVAGDFLLQARQLLGGLRDLGFGSGGARIEFGATLVVGAAAGRPAIKLQIEMVQPFARLPGLAINGGCALRTLAVLGLHLLHGLIARAQILAKGVELGLQPGRMLLQFGEAAGQNQAELAAHFVAQLGKALGFGGLTLQRVHLPRHFVENVVDARQVLLGVDQPGLGQTLAGLELGDAGGFFDDVATVGGLAAQDLPDAALLDERIRLRSEAGTHEDVLDVAQAAELAVELVLALAGTEQAAGDDNLAFYIVRLELTAANLKYYLRSADTAAPSPRHDDPHRPRQARPMGCRRRENLD